jgi:hypothetical protein
MQQNQAPRAKGDYDQALKRLLTRAHDGFLALIAPDMIWRGERATELPAVARRADLVWETESQDGEHGLPNISYACGDVTTCRSSPSSSSCARRRSCPFRHS